MSSSSTDADEFRSLGIVSFPVGDHQELVYSESTGAVSILPSDQVDLLTACTRFGTIVSQADRICTESGLPPDFATPIREALAEFAADGLLVSRRLVESLCSKGSPPPPVTTLGVVTRDRPAALARCLEGYMANARTHERSLEFTVTDDSAAPETRERNRRTVAALRAEHGVKVSYAGREEKARFLEALRREGAADPEILEFALLDPEGVGHTTGANRNALLLATVGEMFVSVDDDTQCLVAPIPGSLPEELALSAGRDPTEVWHFPDREAALRTAPFEEKDFVALHEDLLGRDLGDCVVRSDRTSFDLMDARLLRALVEGRGRVGVSQIGLIGDCAMGSALWILGEEGKSWERLLLSEKNYRTASSSREVIRGSLKRTICNRSFLMTYGAGFDHRALLPPFMPVKRYQDGIFAMTLQKCFRSAGIAHLPWAVLHAPLESRPFSPEDMWEQAGGTFLYNYIIQALDSIELGPVRKDGKERLRALGRHLIELGGLPPREFDDFLRRRIWREAAAEFQRLQRDLEEYEAMAPYWAADVRRSLEAERLAMARADLVVPADLGPDRSPDDACALARRLVLRFGRLLEAWSGIEEAALALRQRGVFLAVPA